MFAEKMMKPDVLSFHPKVHTLARHLLVPSCLEVEDDNLEKQKGSPQESVCKKRDITVASLLKFWSVAKHHVQKGVIHDADLSYIDAVVNYPGFGHAMLKVGLVKYDKRKNCLLLPEMRGEQRKVDVKKSQAALRQKRYRQKLKVMDWIAEGRKAAAELANGGSRYNRQKVFIKHDVAYDEQGRMTTLGSIIIDGKEMQVCFSAPQHNARDKHGRTSWASEITPGDSGVTQSVTDSVTLSGSGRTQRITDSVTFGDSGVTQGVTDSVTRSDSGVTQGVTDHVAGSLSRVIPPRVRARLSFLRSKTLRSKHKTTHSVSESFFTAAVKSKTAQIQNRTWPERSGHPRRHPVSLPETRNVPDIVESLLNVTLSVTLLRDAHGATCVTRKTRHVEPTPLPGLPATSMGKFKLCPDWSPSAQFLANAQLIGLTLSHEATDYEVAEFVHYWMEEGAQHTQKQWETKLARFIGKGRNRLTKRTKSRQTVTLPTSMDYAIPDGFHGG